MKLNIPNSVKTLAWSLFYQAVAFTAGEAATQVTTLDLDPTALAVIGIVLAAVSKAAAKRLAQEKSAS